jgi:glucokinase
VVGPAKVRVCIQCGYLELLLTDIFDNCIQVNGQLVSSGVAQRVLPFFEISKFFHAFPDLGPVRNFFVNPVRVITCGQIVLDFCDSFEHAWVPEQAMLFATVWV